jgi:hypothetical protein
MHLNSLFETRELGGTRDEEAPMISPDRTFIQHCRRRVLGLLALCVAGWVVLILAGYGLVRLIWG